jgi:diguanylate cyclase (GGDEF)-like protein
MRGSTSADGFLKVRARRRYAVAGAGVGIAAATIMNTAVRGWQAPDNLALYVGMCVLVAAVLGTTGYLLGRREDRLWGVSITDPLTGLANRRYFEQRLDEALALCARIRRPLALLIIDVDFLKTFNDKHGHRTGDAVIRAVAGCLAKSCRASDVAARYGGDEFVVLAPSTGADDAAAMARRASALLADISRACGPEEYPLSISVGIADLDAADTRDAKGLFEAADAALLRAKSAGRHRIEVARPSNTVIPFEPRLVQ